MPDGWISTHPANASQTISFPRDESEQISFGQVRGGVVRGSVYQDTTGDGIRSPFDRSLTGTQVFIDLNGDGQFDVDEPTTSMGEFGYHFDTLPAGTYVIYVVTPEGYQASTPLNQTIEVAFDQDVVDVDFGLSSLPGRISGFRWLDENQDGIRDAGEVGLDGLQIYLDLNRDGHLDANEPVTTTMADLPETPTVDELGFYEFDGLAEGKYTVREVGSDGFLQTSPGSLASLSSTADRTFIVNLTNRQIEELDSRGGVINQFPVPQPLRLSTSEVFMTAGTDSLFYLDSDQDFMTLWELNPNTGEVLDSDRLNTSNVDGIAFGGGVVTVVSSRNVLRFDPETDVLDSSSADYRFSGTSLAMLEPTGLLGHIAGFSRSIDLVTDDGDRVVATLNMDSTLPRLESLASNGHSLFASAENRVVALNSFGQVVNEISLEPGNYSGLAVGKAAPTTSDFHFVEVGPGESFTDINFGNIELPRFVVNGAVWRDDDANGIRDLDELGDAGLQVFVESLNGGESVDFVTSADSPWTPDVDEAGIFSANLLPGSYQVTIARDGESQELSNSFENLATAGQTYQLVETFPGELSIELRDLDQKVLQTILIPEAPVYVGPQALAIDGERLVYVDGSEGQLARIWWLDRSSGDLLNSLVVQSSNVTSVSAVTIAEGNLILAGDGPNFIVANENGTIEAPSGLDFVGGVAFDPNSGDMILSGLVAGSPKFARGTVASGFQIFDAPAGLSPSSISIVNGNLIAAENSLPGDPQLVLHRLDANSFTKLGEIDWSQSPTIFGLDSPTPMGNAKYIRVADDLVGDELSFGLSTEMTPLDVNGDGSVDNQDAEAIKAAIVDGVFESAFDLDNNGVLDRQDIQVIANEVSIIGDVNLDGIVNFADFLIISGNFGKDSVGGVLDGDFDLNGRVEFADFLLVSGNFGREA